jgi:hypothetical protein
MTGEPPNGQTEPATAEQWRPAIPPTRLPAGRCSRGWAPAHDSRWLAQAGLLQAVRVWSAATAYADADPTAGSAARKCEERLRALHP